MLFSTKKQQVIKKMVILTVDMYRVSMFCASELDWNCQAQIQSCHFVYTLGGKLSLLNISCNCTQVLPSCKLGLISMRWLFNSSFHNLEIRLLLLRDVCSVSGLKFALFYSICTTCIFLELFCKEMMCFSIENTIKNSTHFTPQNELSSHEKTCKLKCIW